MLYHSIFAPLGGIENVCIKDASKQAAVPGANSNLKVSAKGSKEIRAPPAHSSSPHTTALPPPHTNQPQTVTDQGSNMRNLLVRGSFEVQSSRPFFHIWLIHVCPKSGREMHQSLLRQGIWAERH